jgi:hypothetical protein
VDLTEAENLRRSVAMLPPLAPGLSREEALVVLGELVGALRALRALSGEP